jgi:predicted transcriptional regulator
LREAINKEGRVTDETNLNPVELAAELTAAWLSNANTRATPEEVPAFLRSMHEAITSLMASPTPGEQVEEQAPEYTPAVSVRKSLASRDHLISLIDGKPYRTLTRHLRTNGLTPDEYRRRYGLKDDYPMTAPNYSEQRREMAKKLGLGRKPGQKAPQQRKAKPGS